MIKIFLMQTRLVDLMQTALKKDENYYCKCF